MNEIPLVLFLWAGAFLFAIGFSMLILKRNAIFVLMGVELMLNAANLNLIAFSRQDASSQGLLLGIFVLVVGVCEMAVALALVIQAYRQFQHIDLGRFKSRN
ncbi:NADH-quinone oxidoreductase subunit NuoK [Aquirufa regiilacus]|uniref:NADH-quinone oxidoreductase subunit K n=1 Tax=Aquirufa regiilacus TaxID=3024868 RepID=A0ABU3TU01_9BACT|nr:MULTISPECIES: NADH-quinone oxidoreductase subunit NuoK [unclassified Aquirufa]MDT8887638.1 NADH-quinone oxidoreductase subunit NuoK [Aquirufa sp. LEPPI-3A]MDU0809350.1 NADH-quinone oxidoreductase subunit NuoK [Aquirufa sp. LEOWEIH-7C]